MRPAGQINFVSLIRCVGEEKSQLRGGVEEVSWESKIPKEDFLST